MATFDGLQQRLYVDGRVQKDVSAWNGASAENGDDLTIGANRSTNRDHEFFEGTIDEPMIYNRALTDDEVQRLYQWAREGAGVPTDGFQLTGMHLTRTPTICGADSADDEFEFLTIDPQVHFTLCFTGARPGDHFRLEWRNPLGATKRDAIGGAFRHSDGGGEIQKGFAIAGAEGASTPGEWHLSVFLNDHEIADRPFRISPPPPSVLDIASSTVLTQAALGASYYFQFTAKGGTPPYQWTAIKPLPSGLVISPGGIVTGTPQQRGAFRPIIRAEDSAGHSLTQTFGIGIRELTTDGRVLSRSLLKFRRPR